MANFTETISETEFVLCPEPDLATYSKLNCDEFQDIWPTTVETAVTRGKKLRECKPSVQLRHEYQVGIEYVKPCANQKRSHRKCNQRPYYDIYNSPCIPTHSPPCACCPQASAVRCKTYKKSQTSLPHHKQCPLRIMELAAPTKRHCLDTWRSKSHILPDYMLDRIRQHVMDERPVVEIPDALNCFKKRVSNRSSRSKKSKVSNACMSDMTRYSAIFVHSVARKLDKPLNVTLNPELEKISRIVSYEISRVTGKSSKKGHIKNKNKFEKQMQDEISKKVTAWIDNVLEDTTSKLIQDDLRELEEQEGPVLDIIDDLIDSIVISSEPEEEDAKYYTAEDVTESDTTPDQKPIDLVATLDAESEGHGYDISIKDYVTRELNKEIDKISSKNDFTTVNSGSKPDDSETEENDTNDITMAHIINEKMQTGAKPNDINNDLENINTDIGNKNINIVNGNINILSNVDKVIDDSTDEVNDTDDEVTDNIVTQPENNLTLSSNNASENAFEHVTNDESQDQQENVEVDNVEKSDKSKDQQENVEDDMKLEKSDKSNENYSGNENETGGITNVSALYTNSEESLDDLNKTVKFSKVDDELGRIGDFILENQKLPGLKNRKKGSPKTFSQENIIVFAAPNKHLLSEADEPWPSDIFIGGPKLSANVSKSVMSLGFINENVEEEKQAIDEIPAEVTTPNYKSGDYTSVYNALDVLRNKIHYAQGKTLSHSEEAKIKGIEIPDECESQKFTSDHTQHLKKYQNTNKLGSPTLLTEDMRRLKKELIQSVHTFDYISDKENDNNTNEIASPTLLTDEIKHVKKEILRLAQTFDTDNVVFPNKKVNYRVDAKTAPSWVLSGRCENGRGEPEDSFVKQKHRNKYEINEGDLRILAKNLEIISTNLIIWSNWINTTCRNIRHMKRKSERNKSCRTNTCRQKDIDYWIKLEKYINKDAHFWLKFKHSAKKRLKPYRSMYLQTQTVRPNRAIKCNSNTFKKIHDNCWV